MTKTFELIDSTGRKWKCCFFTATILSMDVIEYTIRRYRVKKTPVFKFSKTLMGGIAEYELSEISSLEDYAQARIERYVQDKRQEQENRDFLKNLMEQG